MSDNSDSNLGSLPLHASDDASNDSNINSDCFDINADGDGDENNLAAIGDNLAGNRNSLAGDRNSLAEVGNIVAGDGNAVADHSNSTIINPSADDLEIAQSLDRLNALYQQALSLHPQFQDPDHEMRDCATCRTMLSTYLFLSQHSHL